MFYSFVVRISREPAKIENIFVNMRALVSDVHGMRSFGSAALNMCYVARGESYVLPLKSIVIFIVKNASS